jgi:hypothetical protein
MEMAALGKIVGVILVVALVAFLHRKLTGAKRDPKGPAQDQS